MGGAASRTMAFKEALSKFEQQELNELTKTYRALTKHSSHPNRIDEATLRKHYYQIEPVLSTRIFRVYVKHSREVQLDPLVDYESFVIGIAMCCRASTEDVKIQYFYELFDYQNREKIGKTDFMTVLESICLSAFKLLESDLLEIGKEVSDPKEIQKFIEKFASALFPSDTSFLSFESFKIFVIKNPQIVDFVQFLIQKEFEPEIEVPESLQSRVSATPMSMIGKSELIDEEISRKLKFHLQPQFQKMNSVLLYSSTSNGYSLTTMLYQLSNKKRDVHHPTLLVVGDSSGNVFGGFAPELWKKHSRESYGNQDAFVFTIKPTLQFFDAKIAGMEIKSIAPNDALQGFMYSSEAGISFGGVPGYHALFLDEAFLMGTTNPTRTFGNPPLNGNGGEFRVATVELWGFVDKEKSKFISDEMEEKEKEGKKSVLDKEENTYVLELLGKNYSAMID